MLTLVLLRVGPVVRKADILVPGAPPVLPLTNGPRAISRGDDIAVSEGDRPGRAWARVLSSSRSVRHCDRRLLLKACVRMRECNSVLDPRDSNRGK